MATNLTSDSIQNFSSLHGFGGTNGDRTKKRL